MDVHTEYGQAAYALTVNTIVQAQSRTAYHISGGQVSPGTSTTEITVSVDPGTVSISSETVDFAGGEPALDPTDSQPRVDVVSVTSTGDFDVTAGTPSAFAPTEDAEGNPIQTHTPFHHWEPAPNDGRDVVGVPLALVLVRPDTADATDLSNAEVNDELLRIGATLENSAFVKGNGEDNGEVTITVNDADFVVQDTTDNRPEYIWRDHSERRLFLGTEDAQPTLNAELDANDNPINGVQELSFTADSNQNIDFFSETTTGGAGEFRLRDASTGYENVVVADENSVDVNRQANLSQGAHFSDNSLTGVTSVKGAAPSGVPFLDLRDDPDGRATLWEITNGDPNAPQQFYCALQPGFDDDRLLNIFNRTTSEPLYQLDAEGDVAAPTGDFFAHGEKVATEPWATNKFASTEDGELIFPSGSATIKFGGVGTTLTVVDKDNGENLFRFTESHNTTMNPLHFTSQTTAGDIPNQTLYVRTDGILSFKDEAGDSHALY